MSYLEGRIQRVAWKRADHPPGKGGYEKPRSMQSGLACSLSQSGEATKTWIKMVHAERVPLLQDFTRIPGPATTNLDDVQGLPLEDMLPPAAGRLLLQSSLSGGGSQAAEAAEKRTMAAAASRAMPAMYDALELLCHVSLGARHTMFPGCEKVVAGVVGRRSEAEARAEAEKWEEARRTIAIFARIVGRIWGPCFLAAASGGGATTEDGY